MSVKLCSISSLPTHRYLLLFSYVGTRYHGFQRRIGRADEMYDGSIQGSLESGLIKSLQPLYGARLCPSSRTDAGVHALMNAAHVDLTHPDPTMIYHPHQVTAAVNHYLRSMGDEILITSTRLVPRTFHSRKDARKREYVYRLAVVDDTRYKHLAGVNYWPPCLEAALPVGQLNKCHVIKSINLDRLQSAMRLFVGEHDFSSFCKRANQPDDSGHSKRLVRNVDAFELTEYRPEEADLADGVNMYQFRVEAKSFLWNQVRRMVGSVIKVGFGQMSENKIKKMLDNKIKWDTSIALAPAHGLWMSTIKYDECDLEFPDDYEQPEYHGYPVHYSFKFDDGEECDNEELEGN